MTTIKEYVGLLEEILDELSQFDDNEVVEMVEQPDGNMLYLVGEEAIDNYKNTLN